MVSKSSDEVTLKSNRRCSMQRLMAYLGYVLIAGLVSVAYSAIPSTPVVMAQDHGGDQGGARRNAVDARADSGVVSLESMLFT